MSGVSHDGVGRRKRTQTVRFMRALQIRLSLHAARYAESSELRCHGSACVIVPIKHSSAMLKIFYKTLILNSRRRHLEKHKSLFGWHTCDYAAEESGTEWPPSRTAFEDRVGWQIVERSSNGREEVRGASG